LRLRAVANLADREFAEATQALGEVLAIRAARYGAEDWRVREIRIDLTHANRLASLTQAQRVELEWARNLNGEAVELRAAGKLKQASEKLDQALELTRSLVGVDAPGALVILWNLAIVAEQRGNEANAEKWYRENVKLHNANYGPDHPEVRKARETLAGFIRASCAAARGARGAEASDLQPSRGVASGDNTARLKPLAGYRCTHRTRTRRIAV
jgi:tetratricopeptide (TPR) repeat protein